MVNDKDAGVRRACAIALRHNESPEARRSGPSSRSSFDGKDRWYLRRLALRSASSRTSSDCLAWAIGSDWDTPAGRDIIWRSRSSKTSDLLVKILLNKETKDEEKPRLFAHWFSVWP